MAKRSQSRTNGFGVILADPPWAFEDKLQMSAVKRGAEANYPTLTMARLKELPVADLANGVCVLGLWVPSALLLESPPGQPTVTEIVHAWGFIHKQTWIWVKTKKGEARDFDEEDNLPEDLGLAFGMGRLGRNCHEVLLVCTRGKYSKHVMAKNIRTVFFHPALPHSRKPEKFQEAFDRIFPHFNKLEMFARRERPGWLCIGNEAPLTMGEDIRDTLPAIIDTLNQCASESVQEVK